MKFGLIGHPLGHSLSPQIHRLLLDLDNDNSTYELFDITPEDMPVKVPKLMEELDGFNVTVPHKVTIIPYLKQLNNIAQSYGAVNTVVTKTALGANTDGIGFTRALQDADIALSGNVLILGAGGVARVFAFEAAKAGCNISIMDLSVERAQVLCNEISEKFSTSCQSYLYDNLISDFDFSKVDLLINATPSGMYPNTENCPLPKEKLTSIPCCYDAVYNPKNTLLSKIIRAGGGKAETGLSMLINQAAAAHTLWRGREYSDEEIAFVIKEIERTNNF